MARRSIPKHPAALYFNELAPLRGHDERCVLFGHFYHSTDSDPDAVLTRTVISAPAQQWGVVSDLDVGERPCGGDFVEEGGQRRLTAVYARGETYRHEGLRRIELGSPPNVGFLSGLRRVSEHVYACGSQNSVYRLDDGVWSDVATTPRVPYGGAEDPIFHAIDGFGADDLFVVGTSGAVQHFDGSAWRVLEVPADAALQQVLCHEAGRVYACGGAGTVLRGGLEGWQRLAVPHDDDFWGMASLGGTVYVCTYRALYEVVGDTLVEVPVAVNRAGSFYRLASNQAFLWATTGTGRVLRFDQREWVELTWPDSV